MVIVEANSIFIIVPQQQGEVIKSQLSSFEHQRVEKKKPLQNELIAAYLPGTGNWLGKQNLKGHV